jgi:hypothetical protein
MEKIGGIFAAQGRLMIFSRSMQIGYEGDVMSVGQCFDDGQSVSQCVLRTQYKVHYIAAAK